MWALLGFSGDMCAFASGVDFHNPARMISMALGMTVALLLWAWGDYGDDKIEGGFVHKCFATARNSIRHKTNIGLSARRMQKIGFVLDIGTGILLGLAGLDITYRKASGFIGIDFRPIEIFYGTFVALAFTALSLEDTMPAALEAKKTFGKIFGSALHKDNMRRIATLFFAPCGIGQVATGVISHDPFILTSGILQSFGGLSLWYSTRLQKQMVNAQLSRPNPNP